MVLVRRSTLLPPPTCVSLCMLPRPKRALPTPFIPVLGHSIFQETASGPFLNVVIRQSVGWLGLPPQRSGSFDCSAVMQLR